MDLTIALFSGYLLAALAPLLFRVFGERIAYGMAMLPLGIAVWFGLRLGSQKAFESTVVSYEWVPELGLSLSLYLDGLSLLFVLVIAGMGALVAVYARGYMAGKDRYGLFYAYLFAFMASMLGVVLAGNLLTLYVFWELTTLTSFLLIGFEHEKDSARQAAVRALLVTSLGGLAMLAGLVLLGLVGGNFEFSGLLTSGDAIREHVLYPTILVLILIGAFAKSAQFPFHFWLPNAMEAPTPVSAYLHSATMVKAGVYLLARLLPVLGDTPEWHVSVTTIGALTMLAGAYLAFFQHDLKAVLAYLTINVLGTLVMLLGIGTKLAVEAAMTYLLAHALYKGALFMMAGTISHEANTLDIRRLGGLRRMMPVTCATAALAGLSMAGVIPLFGFVAKELYFEAVWQAPSAAVWLTAASLLASGLLVAGALIVSIKPFFGEAGSSSHDAREGGFTLTAMPALLAFAGLAMGVFPQVLTGSLVEKSLAAVLRDSHTVELKVWHGVTVPLVLSLTAIGLGALGYFLREQVLNRTSGLRRLHHYGPEAWYAAGMVLLEDIANYQTAFLQNGHLRRYVMVTLIATVALVGWPLSRVDVSELFLSPVRLYLADGIAVGLILVAALVVVNSDERYRAVAALGIVGLNMSWIYARYGAPDLAMTQVVIESLTVLLFVLAFRGLPTFTHVSSRAVRIRDAVLASCTGLFFTMLVLFVTTLPHQPTISEFYAEVSYRHAHGRNVVNAILVDFRALDTMGETTVLAAAAIGVFAIIRLKLEKGTRE